MYKFKVDYSRGHMCSPKHKKCVVKVDWIQSGIQKLDMDGCISEKNVSLYFIVSSLTEQMINIVILFRFNFYKIREITFFCLVMKSVPDEPD